MYVRDSTCGTLTRRFLSDCVHVCVCVCVVLGFKLKALHLLGRCSTIWVTSLVPLYGLFVCLFVSVLGMEARAMCVLGKHLPLSYTPQPRLKGVSTGIKDCAWMPAHTLLHSQRIICNQNLPWPWIWVDGCKYSKGTITECLFSTFENKNAFYRKACYLSGKSPQFFF
jgi:hypothetical protein